MSTRRSFLQSLAASSTLPWLSQAMAETPAALLALPRSTPAAEGVEAAGIMAFLDGIEAGKFELHSLMVLRHGKVIAEGWWAPYAAPLRHTMYSMSKSFTSTAIGFAVSEGKLSVEDQVISFFPNDLPSTISEHLTALKVKHLLSMAVGSEVEPTQGMVKTDNWVRYFLGHKIAHAPGSVFMYNSAATYMCSAIVQRVTGQTVLEYLKPRLFAPLGIDGMTWENCPSGINTGGWGLSIRSEGLAKFGQLLLNKGNWQGKELLPAKWIEEATSFHIQQPGGDKPDRPKAKNDWLQGYGYQFWRCQHGGFRGDGAFGQFTIVLPEQDAVVVMTSETKNMQGELDLVYQHLLPAMKASALPANDAVEAKLAKRLAALALPLPAGLPFAEKQVKVAATEYRLEANSLGLSSVAFDLSNKDSITFIAKAGGQEHRIDCGRSGFILGEAALPGTPPRLISGGKPKQTPLSKIAACARWQDDKTLRLTLRYYETPHSDHLTCVFDGDAVSIDFLTSTAAMSAKPSKDARGTLHGVAAAK